tara:strand:- start:46 stop:609 length:564 start_codon:yes stop_codon:yes gene_type:complete
MSTLKVGTIQDHANANTAISIASNGVVSQPELPRFNVLKGSDQSIPDNTETKITFSEGTDGAHGGRVINKHGLWSTSDNRFTVTATTTGTYLFYAGILHEATHTNHDGYLQFRKNGEKWALTYLNGGYANQTKYGFSTPTVMIPLLSSGDYVELWIYSNIDSNGTVNLNQGNTTTNNRVYLGGHKIA